MDVVARLSSSSAARRQLREPQPGTPFRELDEEDGRLLAQFAMRAKMSPVRADYGLEVHRVVIQDFLGCVEDEVTVQRGDCVRELFRDGHWMFVATTAGQTGFLPATYCKPISALINLPQYASSNAGSSRNSPALTRRSSESSNVFHMAGSRHSLNRVGMNGTGTGGSMSDSSSMHSGVTHRRHGSASPSRLVSHGINPALPGPSASADWHANEAANDSRAPSRSQTIRNRLSLLAALGEDDLARQRNGLQQAAEMSTPGSGLGHLSSGADTPEYGSSPLVSPGKSLDTAMAGARPRRMTAHLSHASQHDIVATTPPCPRRVTGRGRQSRRTSQSHDPNSRPASQASISSLPNVQKSVRLAYNFQASKEGELSLQNGEEVTVLQERGKDWLLVAKDNGESGLVPACLTITVSAVHVPVHGKRTPGPTDGQRVKGHAVAVTTGCVSTDSAIDTGEDGSDSPGFARTTSETSQSSLDSLPAATPGASSGESTANTTANGGSPTVSQGSTPSPGVRKSSTLTPSTRGFRAGSPARSESSYYEDLYSFSQAEAQSPTPGSRQRSRSASRTNLHRIAVDNQSGGGGSRGNEPSPVHSDGETGTRRASPGGSSFSKFFSRKGKSSAAAKAGQSPSPEVSRGQTPPVEAARKTSGGTSAEDPLTHGWRSSQPAYHRQRSRSASRSGMNRVDGGFTLEPVATATRQPASMSVQSSASMSVQSSASMSVQSSASSVASTGSGKTIPVGSAAVFTQPSTASTGTAASGPTAGPSSAYMDNIDLLKMRMRSATLQAQNRSPPSGFLTPGGGGSGAHTRSSSFDEAMGNRRHLRVLFNYTAMVAEELDVKSGIVVVEKPSLSKPGWAWVNVPGTAREGFIPVDFTEPCAAPTPLPTVAALQPRPVASTVAPGAAGFVGAAVVQQQQQQAVFYAAADVSTQQQQQASEKLCTTI